MRGGGARACLEEREEGRDGMMEKGRKWQAIKEAAAERTTSPNNNGAREGEKERGMASQVDLRNS